MHRVGFCAISHVWGCGVRVSTLTPKKDLTFCTRFNVQDVSWTGSITNSSPYTPIQVHWFLRDIFRKYTLVFSTRGWGDGSTHMWLPTHVDLLNISWDLMILVQCYVQSYIINKLIGKLRHLASYVSRHNAMAYDTSPHRWSYQTWKLCRKNLNKEKNYRNDLGGHARCKDSITMKKAQDFVRVGERGIKFTVRTYVLLIYRTSSINCITLWILSLSVLVPRWILIVPFVWSVVIFHGSLP
jgi:hypothetical protein